MTTNSLAGLNMKSSHRCRLCEIPKGVMNTTVYCCFTQDRFRESSQVVHLLHCHQQHFISFLKAPRKARVIAEYTNSKIYIMIEFRSPGGPELCIQKFPMVES